MTKPVNSMLRHLKRLKRDAVATYDRNINNLTKIATKYPSLQISNVDVGGTSLFFYLKSDGLNSNINDFEFVSDSNIHDPYEVIGVSFSFKDKIDDIEITLSSFETVDLIKYNVETNRVSKFYSFENKLKRLNIPDLVLKKIRFGLLKLIKDENLQVNPKIVPSSLKKLMVLM